MAGHGTVARLALRLLALVCIGLALAGVFLPLLPTTPFVLAAAWAASRSSPAVEKWLTEHPLLGPPLQNWRKNRAVPVKAKWLACIMLSISWLILLASGVPAWLLVSLGIFFTGLAIWLTSRPAQ